MDRIALQRRGAQHGTLPGRPIVQPLAERRQILFPHREARRHGVAAKAEKQMSAQEAMHSCRLKPCTLRPLPLPSPFSSMETTMTGPPGLFHQTGGHDADDAGVPVLPPEQDDPVFQKARLPIQQLLRCLDDLLFRLLPGNIDLRQPVGQLAARSSSSQRTSCRAVTALSIRPAALMRGAMA